MTCNTVTCTGYSADVLGYGTQQTGLRQWWIKNINGDLLNWLNFSEDSMKFAGTTWIGIDYLNQFGGNTSVGNLRIFECNNNLIDSKPLIIPMAANWKKWTFTCSFGQTCHWALTDHSWGTGPMPATPPPL